MKSFHPVDQTPPEDFSYVSLCIGYKILANYEIKKSFGNVFITGPLIMIHVSDN